MESPTHSETAKDTGCLFIFKTSGQRRERNRRPVSKSDCRVGADRALGIAGSALHNKPAVLEVDG